jgi:hypothetical protein
MKIAPDKRTVVSAVRGYAAAGQFRAPIHCRNQRLTRNSNGGDH